MEITDSYKKFRKEHQKFLDTVGISEIEYRGIVDNTDTVLSAIATSIENLGPAVNSSNGLTVLIGEGINNLFNQTMYGRSMLNNQRPEVIDPDDFLNDRIKFFELLKQDILVK